MESEITLRGRWNGLLKVLQDGADELGVPLDSITAGKYREMPKAAPFIWLYLEPGDWLGTEQRTSGTATAMIFVGVEPAENAMESTLAANVKAEKIVRLLEDSRLPIAWPTQPITADEVARLYTCYRVEFLIEYEPEA